MFLFDSLPGTIHENFSQVCDFMGVPDFVLNLLASEESWKKRWMVRNEIEEWTDALTEETAAYPDNSAALMSFVDAKYWHVPKDRFRVEHINKDEKGEYKS